jgi:hypothetical protein
VMRGTQKLSDAEERSLQRLVAHAQQEAREKSRPIRALTIGAALILLSMDIVGRLPGMRDNPLYAICNALGWTMAVFALFLMFLYSRRPV